GNCINEKNCYHILRTPRKNVTLINVPHICNEVVEEMKNIEEDLSHVFYYLDELYGTLDALNGDTNVCNRYNEQCKEYIARLRNCDFSANSSLMSVIDKFEEEYYKICPKPVVPVSIQEPKQKSLIDQRTEKPISGAMIQQINKTSTRSQTMQETTTSAIMDTVTGTGTGVIVVPFIMLAIVFVLFKYSPYGSFLKASVKPLRRMLKKNYINQNDLMNSFEETYKNSVDKKYQIVYSSEYY
ncbi:variable surface protein, partial [Plasmodium gonderi]